MVVFYSIIIKKNDMTTNQQSQKRTVYFLSIFLLVFTFSFSQNSVSASSIMKQIKDGKDVSYENVTINGDLDMTFMDEKLPTLPKKRKWWKNGGSNSVEEQIESKVIFKNCVFEGNVYAYFHDDEKIGTGSKYTFIANFENDVIFENCTFKEDALFKYSEFEQDASFAGSTFDDRTTFKYAEFENNVSFANTNFDKSAVFKYTKFKEGVSFNNAQFQDNLDIKYMEVRGDFDVKNMTVANKIDSKYTDINGEGLSKFLLKN